MILQSILELVALLSELVDIKIFWSFFMYPIGTVKNLLTFI